MNIIYIFKNNNSVRFSSFTKIDDLCCTYFYRLVSERTIEENILKKANQKRLLGDLAIEGGNFTTAYFKSVSLLNLLQLFLQDFLNIFFLQSTIQDLFNIDQTLETAAQRMSEIVESRREVPAIAEASMTQPEDKSVAGALETALAACEDDQDVQVTYFVYLITKNALYLSRRL